MERQLLKDLFTTFYGMISGISSALFIMNIFSSQVNIFNIISFVCFFLVIKFEESVDRKIKLMRCFYFGNVLFIVLSLVNLL